MEKWKNMVFEHTPQNPHQGWTKLLQRGFKFQQSPPCCRHPAPVLSPPPTGAVVTQNLQLARPCNSQPPSSCATSWPLTAASTAIGLAPADTVLGYTLKISKTFHSPPRAGGARHDRFWRSFLVHWNYNFGFSWTVDRDSGRFGEYLSCCSWAQFLL